MKVMDWKTTSELLALAALVKLRNKVYTVSPGVDTLLFIQVCPVDPDTSNNICFYKPDNPLVRCEHAQFFLTTSEAEEVAITPYFTTNLEE